MLGLCYCYIRGGKSDGSNLNAVLKAVKLWDLGLVKFSRNVWAVGTNLPARIGNLNTSLSNCCDDKLLASVSP